MLLPLNAPGLARNSETSIWSSETPDFCMRPAILESESPLRTRYSSADSAAAAGRGGARRCPGCRCGRRGVAAGARFGRRGASGSALFTRLGTSGLARLACGHGAGAGGATVRARAALPTSPATSTFRRRRRPGAQGRRRIEQQRVFADQPAGGPRNLEDDVDEGFLHAAIAHQAHEHAAVGTLLERKPGWSAGPRCSRRSRRGTTRAVRPGSAGSPALPASGW